MIRSGSTLQYQVASALIERQGLGSRTGYMAPTDHARVLGGAPSLGLSTFKTHELTAAVEGHCREGTGVVLYSFRDIRDVLSSYQRKVGTTLSPERTAQLIGELLDRDGRWRGMPRVHLSRYEDLVSALASEVRGIARFLDLPCSDAQCAGIAGELSYDAQMASIESAAPGDMVEINATNAYHRRTLLHRNHLQGGGIGRYRAELAAGQRRLVERLAGDWLCAQGYPV